MAWYKETLIDHYKNPRYKGQIKSPTFTSAAHNPSCGDSITFQGIITDNKLTQIAFDGSGCVISQGAASLLAELVAGKSIPEILALTADDMQALVEMELGPNRLRCALLPLEALKEGLLSSHEGM